MTKLKQILKNITLFIWYHFTLFRDQLKTFLPLMRDCILATLVIIKTILGYIGSILSKNISNLTNKLYKYHVDCRRYKVYRFGIEIIPNYWEKERAELKFIILKERFYMISDYGIIILLLFFLFLVYILYWIFVVYITNKYLISYTSELFILPLMLRGARRSMLVSSLRHKFGPIGKTLASKFSVVSLISMLSLETFTSLVFLVIFYLVILIIGGIIVYCNQSDLTQLSLIFSLLPLTEFKESLVDLQSNIIQLAANSQLKTYQLINSWSYLYENYLKYPFYTYIFSCLAHIVHNLDLHYEVIVGIICDHRTTIDSLWFFPMNYILHFIGYLGININFFIIKPFLNFFYTIYLIPVKGLPQFFNNTVFSELYWLYDTIDNLIAYKIYHLQGLGDEGLGKFILNKNWFQDYFVKGIKYNVLKVYYKFTGQRRNLRDLNDLMDGEHILYSDEILPEDPIELFDANEQINETTNQINATPQQDSDYENNSNSESAGSSGSETSTARPLSTSGRGVDNTLLDNRSNNAVVSTVPVDTGSNVTLEQMPNTPSPIPSGDGGFTPFGTIFTHVEGNIWTSEVHQNEFNTLKYILVDSPILRTTIAISVALVIKYSAKVLVNSVIN